MAVNWRGLRRWVSVAVGCLFAGLLAPAAGEAKVRYVPQLGLTSLDPVKVAFSPVDDDVLMVVNEGGRIDLFDISNPDRPIKTAELWAGARDAAFSPKGDRIVAGGLNGSLRWWGLDAQPASKVFKGHKGMVLSVAVSTDGQRIVSGGDDGTVRLWTAEGQPAAEPFEGHGRSVRKVAISPDGTRIVSGGDDGTVRLWKLDGQPAAEPFVGHRDSVLSVAFSPDGTRIVSGGGDGTVRLWTLDGQPVAESFEGHGDSGHRDSVLSVAFSPDGTRIVSAGADGTVRLWNLDGQPAAEPFVGHRNTVRSVAFSPDGTRIASGGEDGTVRLWTLDGQPAAEPFEGHRGAVQSVAFSPDGTRIASGGGDDTVRLWNLDGEPTAEPFKGHPDSVWSVAFSPDGTRILSGGSYGTVSVWNLEGQPAAEPFEGHPDWMPAVAFSPDGTRIASGGEDGTVRLWNLEGQLAAEPFVGHSDSVLSVAFSPDGTRIVSGGEDGTVRVWKLEGQPAAEPFEGHRDFVRSVAFSPDGSRIASGGEDGTVRLWNLEGQPPTEPFEGHRGAVWSVAFSPDGTRIASGGVDSTVRLWKLEGQTPAESFTGHPDWVHPVAFSPDGTRIVSGGFDGTMHLWNLDGQLAAERFEGHPGWVRAVAFSPDGTQIVSGGMDGTVRLWNLDGQLAAEPFEGHPGWVETVAFSPDGTRIVSGGGVGTVRLWDLDGQLAAEPFAGHGGDVSSVAFSPDGTRIVSGSIDGTVRLWNLDGQPMGPPFNAAGSVESSRWLKPELLLIWAGDRVHALSSTLQPHGEIFFQPEGWVAIMKEGVRAPTNELLSQVRAFEKDGQELTRPGAVPAIDAQLARQILFNEFTSWQRFQRATVATARWTKTRYDALGWLRLPFWPALAWTLLVIGLTATWLTRPRKTAHWAMPSKDTPELPKWQWLTNFITLNKFIGTRNRALTAWLRHHHPTLSHQNFTGRDPVQERKKYCALDHAGRITTTANHLAQREPVRLWIHGPGGTGKSALAYEILRRGTLEDSKRPVPVLVDEDWGDNLLAHVARLLRPEGETRGPTPAMARTLGARGHLCVLIDSLSERGTADAREQVAKLVQDERFQAVLVTSREPKPAGQVWEGFEAVEVEPLTRDQVPDYIATYAPEERRAEVEERLQPLLAQDEVKLSPLYLRFAIERALEGELERTSWDALVLTYLERLRAERMDLRSEDMIRACKLAAVESLRNSPTPREFEVERLHGALGTRADDAPFYNAAGTDTVTPPALVDMLVKSGVLHRNRTNRSLLQFTYDPVAEQLVAMG